VTPLPVVPAEAIASHADLFRCEPYRVSLTARACVGRQADARRKSTSTHSTRTTALSKCAGCAVRRERARADRRRAAKAHASPALERAVRGSLRRFARELAQVFARAVLRSAGVG